jgi:hypothetical protein
VAEPDQLSLLQILFSHLTLNRLFETIFATSNSISTNPPGPQAFIKALIWSLECFKHQGGRFSGADLTNKIREARDFTRDQIPVHRIQNALCPERIILNIKWKLKNARPDTLDIESESDDESRAHGEAQKALSKKDILGLKGIKDKNKRRRKSSWFG